MKHADIQKLRDAGLITEEQRRKIIEHFDLKEDGNKFLAIVSIIGAVLITAGIVLLISAHWNEIPRGVKIAAGIALMLAAHAGGWWLREKPLTQSLSPSDGERVSEGRVRGNWGKTGEALHLIGSGLFLANIALIGQIYNIVSRPPNAFLLWWLGIAALPWLLRSKAQHVLLLLAFGIWFGLEVNERTGWIYCGNDERQLLLYSLLGLIYLGAGWLLRGSGRAASGARSDEASLSPSATVASQPRGAFADFAPPAEKLGLLAFLVFFFPLTWKEVFGWRSGDINNWIFPALGLLAIILSALGLKNLRSLTAQWRWTWFAALIAMMIFMATAWFGLWQTDFGGPRYYYWGQSWTYLVATLALFVLCLLQIQVGLQERSEFMVNVGVIFIALDIIAAYFSLFGSMARTGLMFLISGIFLIVFGVYLEKKRRKLMKQIQTTETIQEAQP